MTSENAPAEPQFSELRNSASGSWWEDWYCDVPDELVGYTVTSDEWAGDRLDSPVRKIYAIELSGASRMRNPQAGTDGGIS